MNKGYRPQVRDGLWHRAKVQGNLLQKEAK